MKYNTSNTPCADSPLNSAELLINTAYARYQLAWMADHGYTALDLAHALLSYKAELDELGDGSSMTAQEVYADWEANSGFGGSLWACKAEFLEVEFQDKAFMIGILSQEEMELWNQLQD